VARLRRLRQATERGHPIGRIAELAEDQLSALLADASERQNRAAANAFVRRILEAAASFRPGECERALTLAISLLPPDQLIEDVLEPALVQVGERWHTGEFSIAQERLVSACVRRHVGLVIDAYERLSRGPTIVFATLPGEAHELGLLMSALLAASKGFRCQYLGPDLPAHELAQYANQVNAVAIAVSLVLRPIPPSLRSDLESLRARTRAGTEILIGGAATTALAPDELPQRCTCVRNRAEFEERLNLLADAHD
jgi:methanogenic corrinoid protein MtbC1